MPSRDEPLWQRILWRLTPRSENSARRKLLSGHLDLSSDSVPDVQMLTEWIDACLAEDGGQIASRARADTLRRSYRRLNATGRVRFLVLLMERYSTDPVVIEKATKAWQDSGPEQRPLAELALRDALEPPRLKLLAQLNSVPEGPKLLIDMRVDVIALLSELPELKPLEADLKRLLTAWFDVGLLRMEQISWEHSSAALLEKLIAYEAVHPVHGWDDLKNRLRADRRCYALFHPSMPTDPLIFVQVALTKGLADNVQDILDEASPVVPVETADTAIFYAISNAQRGLGGIHFGNYLIKSVVAELQNALPHVKQFSTLSPIPGFHHWLDRQPRERWVPEHCSEEVWRALHTAPDAAAKELRSLSAIERRDLLGVVARYLVEEKRGSTLRARDPVAHFHLANGAIVERLNWLGDTSPRGLAQSCGVMVNYLYAVKKLEQRSRDYGHHAEVPMSLHVRRLIKESNSIPRNATPDSIAGQ
ncbi:MAG TPA: malonyl-CoA decarboxylase [Nevskiaceae bacterium]|nr:malonyl-CoA decarboxylase [Nevskiaceae bacterium]